MLWLWKNGTTLDLQIHLRHVVGAPCCRYVQSAVLFWVLACSVEVGVVRVAIAVNAKCSGLLMVGVAVVLLVVLSWSRVVCWSVACRAVGTDGLE
eukprot:3343470-Pyramimonas_sp.AAC.1